MSELTHQLELLEHAFSRQMPSARFGYVETCDLQAYLRMDVPDSGHWLFAPEAGLIALMAEEPLVRPDRTTNRGWRRAFEGLRVLLATATQSRLGWA